MTASACSGTPTVIAFKSSVSGATCQLIYAYWFGSGTVKKSKQVNCGDVLTLVGAIDIIDTANVTIDSYTLGVTLGPSINTTKYYWATVDLSGHSGIKLNERNNFEVRTGISQRIGDY